MLGYGTTTIAGPSSGNHCYFPFEYEGALHYTCITDNTTSSPWCSSTPRYSENSFGYCNCPFKGKYNQNGLQGDSFQTS